MARDVQVVRQMGPARGVDESANPREGTVAEAFNIETCDGVWKGRPGIGYYEVADATWDVNPKIFAEYIPDFHYEGSSYHALLLGGGTAGTLRELVGSTGRAGTYTTLTGHAQAAANREYTWVQGLYRYEQKQRHTNVPKYSVAILVTNGVERPFVYRQTSGSGETVPLDAIDPGVGISCLSDPPWGKCVAVYKSRFFMGNIEGGSGNRLAWSGPDDALAFPMNVWPAAYNMDVGGPEPITALCSWKDFLIVLKENFVYLISGDGVGGVWTIQEISSGNQGCIGANCFADIGNEVYFYNSFGAFVFNGRSIKNISHPRLQKTWAKMDWNKPGPPVTAGDYRKMFWCTHDSLNKRVIFNASLFSRSSTHALVYNYGVDTWDIWGMFPDNVFKNATFPPTSKLYFLPPGREFRRLCPGPYLTFFDSNSSFSTLSKFKIADEISNLTPIVWKIKTHPLVDSEEYGLLRNVVLHSKKNGNWTQTIIPMLDGESIEQVFIRNTTKHNFITDATKAQEHDVDGTSNFLTVTDGPVDVWFLPQLTRCFDSLALTTASANTKIKFAATQNFSATHANPMPGSFLVIPEDTAPVYTVTMYDSDQSLYKPYSGALSFGLYDEARVFSIQYQKIVINTNVTGRQISLLLTNLGTVTTWYTYDGSPTFTYELAGADMFGKLDCKGWEMWIRPLATRRGGL